VSRGERIGLSVAASGVGITVVSTALGLANVHMSALGLWLMGGFGGLLMFGGVTGAVVSWRQRDTHEPITAEKTQALADKLGAIYNAYDAQLVPVVRTRSGMGLKYENKPAADQAWDRYHALVPEVLAIYGHAAKAGLLPDDAPSRDSIRKPRRLHRLPHIANLLSRLAEERSES